MSIQLRGGNQLIDAIKVLQAGNIKQGETVADLGCGTTGHFVFPAAHLVGPTGKVYAVDLQKSVLAAIQSREKLEGLDNVDTVWDDLEKAGRLKLPDGSVDLTLLLNILAQVQDKATVLREAARITKSRGQLIISDWKLTASPLGPPPANRLDPQTAKQLALSAGWELTAEFEPGPYHYGLVFRKPS